MGTEQQGSGIKAMDVRFNRLFLVGCSQQFHFRWGYWKSPWLSLRSLTDLWFLWIATLTVILAAYYGLLTPSNLQKEKKWMVWLFFWSQPRGISVLKRWQHKAGYTIRISDTFMILPLSDIPLQRNVDMLYLINCLFIITKVQCGEEKKHTWVASVSHNSTRVKAKGQDREGRVSGSKAFSPLFSFESTPSVSASRVMRCGKPRKYPHEPKGQVKPMELSLA